MRKLDAYLGKFVAMANLIDQKCQLNHGEGIEPPEAVDYLCQYVGDVSNDYPDALLRIPICKECIDALYDEDWLLFYCLTCNSSQWLMKSKAKRYYPPQDSIRFLMACPNCYKKEKKQTT